MNGSAPIYCPTCGHAQPQCARCTNYLPLPTPEGSVRARFFPTWFCDDCLAECGIDAEAPDALVKFRAEIVKTLAHGHVRIVRETTGP